jgi:hypothetical protein
LFEVPLQNIVLFTFNKLVLSLINAKSTQRVETLVNFIKLVFAPFPSYPTDPYPVAHKLHGKQTYNN